MNNIERHEFNVNPESSHIIFRLDETLHPSIPSSDLTAGYSYRPDLIYINTVSEQELDFGNKGTVKVTLNKTYSSQEYADATLSYSSLYFLTELYLWNTFRSTTAGFIGGITDDLTDEASISITEDTTMIQVVIFKNLPENANEIKVVIREINLT